MQPEKEWMSEWHKRPDQSAEWYVSFPKQDKNVQEDKINEIVNYLLYCNNAKLCNGNGTLCAHNDLYRLF